MLPSVSRPGCQVLGAGKARPSGSRPGRGSSYCPQPRFIVLRAHLLSAASLPRLLALRERTGVHLVAVCHTRHLPAALRTALRHVEHRTVSANDTAAG
ncbi:hypothetical protein SAMN05428939_0001, partial [Streptomyces sp. TLI_105]